jgi:hypothetical protein
MTASEARELTKTNTRKAPDIFPILAKIKKAAERGEWTAFYQLPDGVEGLEYADALIAMGYTCTHSVVGPPPLGIGRSLGIGSKLYISWK